MVLVADVDAVAGGLASLAPFGHGEERVSRRPFGFDVALIATERLSHDVAGACMAAGFDLRVDDAPVPLGQTDVSAIVCHAESLQAKGRMPTASLRDDCIAP